MKCVIQYTTKLLNKKSALILAAEELIMRTTLNKLKIDALKISF